MKKIFLLIFLALGLLVSKTKAQTESGTFLLGGNASFQAISGSSSLTIAPNVGVFVIKNLAFGINADLIAQNGTTWYIGPFGRYYFSQQNNGKFFGQVGINVGHSVGNTQFGTGLAAGYALFLNQAVALEFSANYNKVGSGNGIFSLNVGFQIHLKRY